MIGGNAHGNDPSLQSPGLYTGQGKRSSGRGERQLAGDLQQGLVERGARFLLAAAATVRAAGSGLQFGKGAHAIGRLAADGVIGDGLPYFSLT